MRLLVGPEAPGADVNALYQDPERPDPGTRPWIALNMVVSVDGATAVQGRSGGLGGPADRRAFHALRAAADVIVAGAGTVRAEHYGPPRTTEADQRRRVARGQPAFPRLAVVSSRLQLDPTTSLFTDTPTRPLVITHAESPSDLRARLAAVAEVVVRGQREVDLAGAFAQLRQRGASFVLVEGGPMLNGRLAAADLVDEVCLTISPQLAGGPASGLLGGAALAAAQRLTLVHLLEESGMLLARYRRA